MKESACNMGMVRSRRPWHRKVLGVNVSRDHSQSTISSLGLYPLGQVVLVVITVKVQGQVALLRSESVRVSNITSR